MMRFKDIPILITKLLRFSTKTMCKCLNKYPLLSGTLLVFILLHIFFPFTFVLSVCSVPFFLAALYLYYTRFRFQKSPDSHRDLPSIKCETKNTLKLKKPYISPQMSRRRNFRAKIEDSVPNEHKPMFEASSPMKHFLSPEESLNQDDQNFVSRNEKVIEESLIEFKNEKIDSKNNSQEDYVDNEKDEKVKVRERLRNRIAAWTEDDKKNLMDPLQENSDIGLSEMERNQRLENLIARRRARKFLMAIRGQVSLLYENELETVKKMAPVKTDNVRSSDEDPVPGSAPSVLLPTRNPFDIPYDPTEEKPNLTVDGGFQQEFLGPHQISRHGSFTMGGKSFEIDRDRDSMRPAQRRYMDRVVKRESRFARLRRQSGDHGTFIEQFLHQHQDDPDEDESRSSPNKDKQEPESSSQPKDTENTSDEQPSARNSQEASSSSNAVENQTQEQKISSYSSDQLLPESSDGEQEMEKESINFESREEAMEVEEDVMKQQEPEVIEIGRSSMGGEDKSSVSVGNIEDDEDEGGVLGTQSRSNEERRDGKRRSCESLGQVVDIPEEQEEGSIFLVDNSQSMPPISPEQAAEDSKPTLLENPEEIDNQQPPVEDEPDTRNIQDDELSNQTGQDIISDTRKYDDQEYINPFANSVEEVDVIETNNLIGSTTSSHGNSDEKFGREGDDITEESPPEQLKFEPLDILESRGGESQPSSEPVEGSRGEETQAKGGLV